jgi:hypothetical protein
MKYNLLKILTGIAVLVLFNRCAQVGVLTGGKKDTKAPKLLLAIPEQKTLNFKSDVIILKFDEFIQLKDLNNQLVISPKIKTKPEITASGKNLIISIPNKQELLPNTTYRFYFGKAIVDMHEGNPITNFSYIFSTGSQIDSLNLKGTVFNALQRNKEKDVVVGLYFNKDLPDSFPYINTPDYVTRTDESGSFLFTNLPSRNFRLLCFTDKNKDYLYTGPDNEQIGFLEEPIQLNSDTSFKLNLFSEIPIKTFIKKVVMNENGKGLILYNQKTVTTLMTYDENFNSDLYLPYKGKESDSCEFYYRNFKDTLWLKINYGNGSNHITDTLRLKVPIVRQKNKYIIKATSSLLSGKLYYNETPSVKLSQWIDTTKANINGLHLNSKTDTLINKEVVKINWLDENSFTILNQFKPKTAYQLKIDTGVFYGFNNLRNDSIRFPFALVNKSDLGSLTLKITFNIKQSYIVQLINTTNAVVKQKSVEFSLSASNTASLTFKDMEEDTYRVRIIYDTNEDEIWNTGNYLKKINPEKAYIFEKAIKILPDWEIEEEFILKE